jgi:hypothetical protein
MADTGVRFENALLVISSVDNRGIGDFKDADGIGNSKLSRA